MTTTVLTLTMTGLAADSRSAGGANPRWQRRLGTVVLMFAGAAVGAVLVVHGHLAWSLGAATLLVFAATLLCLTLPADEKSGTT